MLDTYINEDNKIIELTISGSISREELQRTFKEIEEPIKTWDDYRVLKRVDSFTGIEPMALFDDFKFAFENFAHFKNVKKIAVVTDKDWIQKLSEYSKLLVPAEVKVFENEEIEDARTWLK